MTVPRVLAIMGSGETAPPMRAVHADLLLRAGGDDITAVVLDTPHGFQENADDLAARTLKYFSDSVGHTVEVATFRDAETATALQYEQMCVRVAQADWVFAGPGSPSYALRQWRDTRVPELLKEKLRTGGVVVFGSAAAVGLGEVALPIYEIYKAGERPHWIPGMDLLRETGLRAAVIPHYDNAEGGTHDTRFCYMGERRLCVLEAMLPEGCAILGVDEHTACIIDLESGTLTVSGRGRVTWRVAGSETHWRDGDVVPIADIGKQGGAAPLASVTPSNAGPRGSATEPDDARTDPFMDEINHHRDGALAALAARDADGTVAAILAIDESLHEWSQDSLQSGEPDKARAVMRDLMVRLAALAQAGSADPREQLAPLVDALLVLRQRARAEGRFGEADQLRDALVAGGIEIRDVESGSTWDLR